MDKAEFLAAKAAEMRRAPTKAERYLLYNLGEREWGCQVPLCGTYITDFLHKSLGLVIEADGGYHESVSQREYDRARDRMMVAHGYQVLRFTNRDVYQRMGWVLQCIHRRLNVTRRLRGLPTVSPEVRKPAHPIIPDKSKQRLALSTHRVCARDLE